MFVYEKKNGKQKHEDLKYMIIAGEVASSSTCAKPIILRNGTIVIDDLETCMSCTKGELVF